MATQISEGDIYGADCRSCGEEFLYWTVEQERIGLCHICLADKAQLIEDAYKKRISHSLRIIATYLEPTPAQSAIEKIQEDTRYV